MQGVKTSSESREAMTKARDIVKGLAKDKPTFKLHCVGKEATKEAIRAMGITKAVGVDGLPCSFWKEYCEELYPLRQDHDQHQHTNGDLSNHVQGRHRDPSLQGRQKDKADPASYRPVSVLPALSKVLEAIVVQAVHCIP